MATNNTSAKLPPAHDFAPSWLKIPSYCEDPYGKTEVKTSNQRDDLNTAIPSHYVSSTQDSSSLSNFISKREKLGTAGERKNNYRSSRHNSLDYDDSVKPILLSNNSSHLQRPHSRHDFRDSPYNKITCSDYVDPKRKQCNGVDIINSDNFNQEFPLLQGDNVEEQKSPFISSPNGGVWEKSRSGQALGANPAWKVQLIKRSENLDNQNVSLTYSSTHSSTANLNINNNNNHATTKTVFHRNSTKPTTLKTMSTSKNNRVGDIIKINAKDGSLNNGFSRVVPPPPVAPVPNSIAKKSSTTPPPTLHIMVKTPKCRTNKNEFLKSLRTEKKAKVVQEDAEPEKGEKSLEEETITTTTTTTTTTSTSISVTDTTTTTTTPLYVDKERNQEIPILSSSLEAEQRLLRQMGWKDDDETYAPLTEDELKEIGYLKEKLMVSDRPRNNCPRKLPKPIPINVNTSPTSITESWSHDSSSSDSDFSDDYS